MRALGLLLLGGCHTVFGLERNPVEDLCPATTVDDSFDSGMPCEPWGSLTNVASAVAIDSGQLVVRTTPNVLAGAGCNYRGTTPLGAGGVALEVTQVPAGDTSYVALQAFPRDPAHLELSIFYARGALTARTGMMTLSTQPYDASKMRWWRVRPHPDGTGMLAEASGDDLTYVELTFLPGVVPDQVRMSFLTGAAATEQAEQTISFGAARICAAVE